jgi:hypothetical protein
MYNGIKKQLARKKKDQKQNFMRDHEIDGCGDENIYK